MATTLPSDHKALLFRSTSQPLELTKQPVPEASSGSAVIRVLGTNILSYAKEVFNGTRTYPYPSPFVPGSSSVGKIVALGPDATTLAPGDVVLTDMFLRARDNPDALCLHGLHQGGSEGSRRLVENEWRHGTYAEYAKVPLENCLKLPNDGRDPTDWLRLNRLCVPLGGLTNDGGLDLKPGETVVVAPATGQFGGSAVELALAMGARVVALGRNSIALEALQKGLSDYGQRIKTVQITGDAEADAKAVGKVDCYFDISPPTAGTSTHIKSCFLALKPRGRVCLMGGIQGDVPIPHGKIYRENISITGKWMYERDAPGKLVKLVEAGLLNLDRTSSKSYPLEKWEEAIESAAQDARWGSSVCFTP